jgi:hypothetical protein
MSSIFAPVENLGTRAAAARDAAVRALRDRPACTTPDCNEARAGTGIFGVIFGSGYAALGTTTPQGVFGIFYYLALVVFLIFLTLMFVHFTMYPVFSFSPDDSGFIPIPTASDRQVFFTSTPAAYDVSANFLGLPACSYTLCSDVYLSGAFMTSETPKVILYRSENHVETGGTKDNLVNTYPDTNLIVWIDPIANDLYVSVVTGEDGNRKIETSDPIENVPVRKVFRVALVITPDFIEVYINGKLEKSMAIIGQLVTIPQKSYVYSTIRPVVSNVMTGNISMWPRILTAREIKSKEGAPSKSESFFFK